MKNDKVSTVCQAIVETLEAPRLTDIKTEDFVKFKERSIYRRRGLDKNKEYNDDVPLTNYRDSTDDSILELFLIASWVDASSVDTITEEQLRNCLEER